MSQSREEFIADVTDQIAEELARAGAPASLIYAFRKTGFILSELNEHLFSASDLKEWNDAIEEYEKKGV